MNRDVLIEYCERSRVEDSDVVYDSNGGIESGWFNTAKSAEVASNLWMGMQRYYDHKSDELLIYSFGKLIITI